MNAEHASKQAIRKPPLGDQGEGCRRVGKRHETSTGPFPPGVLALACVDDGRRGNTGRPVDDAHGSTGPAANRAGRVVDGSVIPETPGHAGGGQGTGMVATDESLVGPAKVRTFQTVLHDKAKGEPEFRFYAIDKVWRTDILADAWKQVRRNGGFARVDGQTVETIEACGVEPWLGDMSRDLGKGPYVPNAVRQMLLPKIQPGKVRPLGIPCIRDRVAQTSAMLVLSPIIKADLQPEQFAYRPERSAQDAVKRVHSLLNRGMTKGRLRPVQRCRRDTACRTDDEHRPARERRADAHIHQGVAGHACRRGRRQGQKTPHEPCPRGAEGIPARSPDIVASQHPLHPSLHAGLEGTGPRPAFCAIVCYADDLFLPGKAPAADMPAVLKRMMGQLRRPVNENTLGTTNIT